ncbi:MAG: hypothetical protein AB7S38_42365 [Vulcanimicrobiota bacterium]
MIKETIYARFSDVEMAKKAIGALLDTGLEPELISLVTKNSVKPEKVEDAEEVKQSAAKGVTTTTPEDAGEGAAKGALIGLGLGELALIATLFIPGVGFVTGGGALVTALGAAVGTAAAGAVTGGVVGYLREQGVPSDIASDYERAIEEGGAMLAIDIPDEPELRTANVVRLLQKYDADKVGNYAAAIK